MIPLSHIDDNSNFIFYRVKDHMASEHIAKELPGDRDVLSRFIVTKTCDDENAHDGVEKTTWEEWIEPLSVHFRHPFSFTSGSKELDEAFQNFPKELQQPLITSDHILLQSSLSLHISR